MKGCPWMRRLVVLLSAVPLTVLVPRLAGAQTGQTPPQPAADSVVLREDSTDGERTIVVLRNAATGQETVFLSLPDIYRDHYHCAEYHNGHVYLIRRTGKGQPTWTDELWRYAPDGQGRKLYSVEGLDYRVSDDERCLAVSNGDDVRILDHDGKLLTTLNADALLVTRKSSPMFNLLAWSPRALWVSNTFGPSLAGLVRIDSATFAPTKFDLSRLQAGPEFAVNVVSEEVVFSDYPAFFDADSALAYEHSGAKVTLVVFGLRDSRRQQIATSVARKFEPTWVDAHTIEYNDAAAAGRIRKTIR